MSGHSKWATTKHKKAVVDAKRGKLFAKLIKNIEVAARTGGGDPDGNPTLYDAIVRRPARTRSPTTTSSVRSSAAPVPRPAEPTTRRSCTRATGRAGVAVLIECLTDNRNRAASDVRVAMTRNGGSMADPGSVSYLFSRKGVVIVPKTAELTEDDVLAAVLDAGAEEVNDLGDVVRGGQRGHRPGRGPHGPAGRPASTTSRPRHRSCRASPSSSTRRRRRKVFRLIEALEDSDDVQNVWANFDVSDEVMAAVG